jgi:carboxymethylenebutenolidase
LELFSPLPWHASEPSKEIVDFKSGKMSLHGILYRPLGPGPFPAVLYNHGSAPGMLNNQLSDVLGWVFFMPYRRGQGLSASAGPYIMDEVDAAEKKSGLKEGAKTMTRLLKTDHLEDQLAALDWLKKTGFVEQNRIAAFGNSFGGIETVLGAEYGKYCARPLMRQEAQ